jgi:hypothetical protein
MIWPFKRKPEPPPWTVEAVDNLPGGWWKVTVSDNEGRVWTFRAWQIHPLGFHYPRPQVGCKVIRQPLDLGHYPCRWAVEIGDTWYYFLHHYA